VHIAEKILSPPVLAAGVALTAAGTYMGLRKLDYEKIPMVGLLSATFFVASFVHVPVGPSSAHLIMNGLAGMLLGWSVFPAFLVALALQALLFQYGGITTLGVNTFNMAMPGLVCYALFHGLLRAGAPLSTVAAWCGGALAVFLSGALVATSLYLSGSAFAASAAAVWVAHVPIMFIEGFVCAFCVAFLRKVRPEMLMWERLNVCVEDA